MKKSNISLDSYKGTRDFYPEDQFIQEYIFSVMRKVIERYGYEPYNASLLEETTLYRAKSGDEIANEQTYTFIDRGGRDVTIRPEMTPTVARMIAKRRQELSFPLRWYSIPNVFRYERPQRGRLREHWQLNADIFGISGIEAEIEIIEIANAILKEFGSKEKDFEIRINNRKLMNAFLKEILKLPEKESHALTRFIDKKEKIEKNIFEKEIKNIVGNKAENVLSYLTIKNIDEIPSTLKKFDGYKEIETVLKTLEKEKIVVRFCPSLMRGFDYYTGIVFEVFDTNKDNPRSLFGGGRYDDLLNVFGVEAIPAVGFGMGDVTTKDYLETHNLLPQYKPKTEVYISCIEEKTFPYAKKIAQEMRQKGISVALDFTDRKINAQIKNVIKQNIPFFIVIGEDEIKTNIISLKNMKEKNEERGTLKEIIKKIILKKT